MRGDDQIKAQDMGRNPKSLRLVGAVGSSGEDASSTAGAASAAALRDLPPIGGIEGFRTGDTPPTGVRLLREVPKTPQTDKARERSREISARRESLRESRKKSKMAERTRIYRRRRGLFAILTFLAVIVVGLIALAIMTLSGAERPLPISPEAGTDARIASVGEVNLTVPVEPDALTGLGYHAGGEYLSEMTPAGEKMSMNLLAALVPGGSNPDGVHYAIMDAAGRDGSNTGSLDIGAKAGTKVYSPVTGMVTSIRPDPSVKDANIVEIQPQDDPNLSLSVSLVNSGTGDIGVNSPVEAGETELGTVVDSAKYLDPQLADYTDDAGNHITLSIVRTG